MHTLCETESLAPLVRILNGNSWILCWYQVITTQPYMYESLPQAPLLHSSSMSASALLDGCPVHACIDSLSMSLVSIQNFISITYVIRFWITIIDNNCAAISMPLDNGYFTCFIDLLVSDAPLHSDVVLGVDWLSIVCTATLDCCISFFLLIIIH